MKTLFFIALAATLIGLSIWLLPWWATVALIVLVLLPVGWFAWKILTTLKSAVQQIKEGMPKAQERVAALPADEPFRGNGFAFTFPVPCDVSQTVIDDLEIFLLRPKLDPTAATEQSLLVVSTMPREELRDQVGARLDAIFEQVQEIHREPFAPVQIGALAGERCTFEAAKDGKTLRGEMVWLGDAAHSVGWILATAADTFDPRAAQLRELATLVRRTEGDLPQRTVSTGRLSEPRYRFGIPAAMLAVLAGELEGGWAVNWRMKVFHWLVKLQSRWTLVPRINTFADPSPTPSPTPASTHSNGAEGM